MSDEPAFEASEEHEAPEPIVPPLNGVLQNSDRISWRTIWYYEQEELDTFEASSTGCLLTRYKDAQPYSRQLPLAIGKVMPVDIGFVEHPRVIIIDNATKWRGQFNPTDEQRQQVASSSIHVTIGTELVAILRPGQMQHFWVNAEVASRMTITNIGEIVSRIKLTVMSE